jgi:tetratricopeptide (TPR) repeat protein
MRRLGLLFVMIPLCAWMACGGGGDGGSGPDPQPPKITGGPAASGITSGGATIEWTTDKDSNSIVRYGKTSAYTDSVRTETLVRNHSVGISDLDPLQGYHYSVASEDADGRRVESGNKTFQTLSPAPELVEEGWDFFEQGDLSSSLERMKDAYSYETDNVEVLEGLGWTLLKLYELESSHPESLSARSTFESALQISPNRVDCLVGIAFLYQSIDMCSEAITAASAALSKGGEGYEFAHDSDITASDVRYCLLLCLAATGDFTEALSQVKILDPSVDLDPDNAATWDGHLSFEEALIVVIESLRDQV